MNTIFPAFDGIAKFLFRVKVVALDPLANCTVWMLFRPVVKGEDAVPPPGLITLMIWVLVGVIPFCGGAMLMILGRCWVVVTGVDGEDEEAAIRIGDGGDGMTWLVVVAFEDDLLLVLLMEATAAFRALSALETLPVLPFRM